MKLALNILLFVSVTAVYAVVLLPLLPTTDAAEAPVEQTMLDRPHFFLGPWQWRDDCWQAPDGTIGLIDLRGSKDCAIPEVASGVGFFACRAELGPEYTDLGTNLDGIIDSKLWTVYDVPLQGFTVRDLLWNQLTIWADPTGESWNGPIHPTPKGSLEVWLNIEEPKSDLTIFALPVSRANTEILTPTLPDPPRAEPLLCREWRGIEDPVWPAIRPGVKRQYRDAPVKLRGKLLTDWQEVYRIKDVREFIPSDMPLIKPAPKETSCAESFNKSDADGLGPDLTWTEVAGDLDVVSNTARPGSDSTYSSARAEHDMSSVNHWAQAVITELGQTLSGTSIARVCARYSSSADTYYAAKRRCTAITSWDYSLTKVVAGTETLLSGSETSLAYTSPETLRCTINGSTLAISVNGSAIQTLTDTAITTGTRGGISGYKGGLTGAVWFDSYASSDLATGVAWLVDPPIIRSLIDGGLVR